ncbi:MAG TPA: PQQ-dependent sugar dehydrogenase [Candidatus Krumholzibacteria bacterium]|nr:PQQ-dependent sugar dehydrogenase [Candidatus Krumholzibacteria bacterium]
MLSVARMMRADPRGFALAATFVVACSSSDDNNGVITPPVNYGYDLVEAFPSLTFSRPVDIRNAGDGTNRLFVVEQTGRILVFPNDKAAAAVDVFLDITASVAYRSQGELGLLGLAFHPDYASNGFFFVYYTTGASGARRARLSRFHVSADPNVADPASESVLLDFAEPEDNHNGGALCFGGDGYLYIGVGDGGGTGDPGGNGQNRQTLLGSILRLDVDQNVATPPYHAIPPDNPYVGNANGYAEEIYAYGLRNPWRISYDAAGGVLWAGDVGQAAWEEIDQIVSGANYGWNCREGRHDYPGQSSPLCATATGFVEPVFDYGHDVGRSITGGYVYRGTALPSLAGRYVYADFVTGIVWALKSGAPVETDVLRDTSLFIPTFGVDEDGELLLAAYFATGDPSKLYRIEEIEVTE